LSSLWPAARPRGRETVLLVEDEDMVRDLNRQILQMCGYTVVPARDGLEALATSGSRGDRVDLLVTDVQMPRMGGPDLAQSLVARRPGVKVLFLSGLADGEGAGPAGLPAGAPFLAKPYTPTELAGKVRGVPDARSGG
jgi:two-component system, cell cycle sensor histidine kinase and response regulator CckA